MEQFLIEVFTKLFATSGIPILVFLAPVLGFVMSLLVLWGICGICLGVYLIISNTYNASAWATRNKEKAYRRKLQRALDLWQHGYIEYRVKREFGEGSFHYIVRKERHEGERYWKESLVKAHKAHTLGMVARDKLSWRDKMVIRETASNFVY